MVGCVHCSPYAEVPAARQEKPTKILGFRIALNWIMSGKPSILPGDIEATIKG
jgi:hypothetical protein